MSRYSVAHADRDRAVDVLRIAAGDGLLTADELNERLEAALPARTLSELTALTADLRLRGLRGLCAGTLEDLLLMPVDELDIDDGPSGPGLRNWSAMEGVDGLSRGAAGHVQRGPLNPQVGQTAEHSQIDERVVQ